MEIKVPMAYPVWLAELLCELEIYPISFSKYGTVYTNSVLSGVLQEQKAGAESKGMPEKSRKEKESCLQVYSVV